MTAIFYMRLCVHNILWPLTGLSPPTSNLFQSNPTVRTALCREWRTQMSIILTLIAFLVVRVYYSVTLIESLNIRRM